MKTKARKAVVRWVYPIAALLAGVFEVVQQGGDIFDMSWPEMLKRCLRAAPFVFFGFISRQMLLTDPAEIDDKKSDKVE